MNSASSPLWGKALAACPLCDSDTLGPAMRRAAIPLLPPKSRASLRLCRLNTRLPATGAKAKLINAQTLGGQQGWGKARGTEWAALYPFLGMPGTWKSCCSSGHISPAHPGTWESNLGWHRMVHTEWASAGKCGPSHHGLLLFHYLQILFSLQQLLNKFNILQILFLCYYPCFKIFFFHCLEKYFYRILTFWASEEWFISDLWSPSPATIE